MNMQPTCPITRTKGPSFADIDETTRELRVQAMINTSAAMNAAKYRSEGL